MKFGTGFVLTAQADPIALRDMAQTLERIIEARQVLAAAGY